MNNPLVKIPRLVPVAEKINQLRKQVEGEFEVSISFDGMGHPMDFTHYSVWISLRSMICVQGMVGQQCCVFTVVAG